MVILAPADLQAALAAWEALAALERAALQALLLSLVLPFLLLGENNREGPMCSLQIDDVAPGIPPLD
jgi:hypothetical protein